MTLQQDLKQQIVAALDELPEHVLPEVATYQDYLQYKLSQRPNRPPPYEPVALGCLWEGVTISDEDIDEVRREMWGNFGDREI